MSCRPAPSRRPSRAASFLLACTAVAAFLLPRVAPAQPAATEAEPAQAAGLTVPPVPDGTPDELMNFIKGLMPPKAQPRSPQEAARYVQDVAAASVQVADKILAQVKPEDAGHVAAAKLKLESLTMLAGMGDPQAAKDMAAYAASLETSPNQELAMEGKRMLLVSEAQQMFSSGNLAAAPALIDKVAALVAANPDDVQIAGLAAQFSRHFGNFKDGAPFELKAYEAFGPLFANSKNPDVRSLGELFASKVRWMTLPGKPVEITGKLLDGRPFDQKSLAGKVVLVDFWASWLGPERAELPAMKKAYEKYHDKGFEVVGISLDEDRGALEKFVASQEIPWPILHENPADGSDVTARHYGISGIPQRILIGRDGNVITLDARAERLGEELEKLFKDAG